MYEIPRRGGTTLTAQVVCAERAARLLIAGFRLCADDGSPLSERQQCALVTTALLEFDGFGDAVQRATTFDEIVARLVGEDGLS